MADPEGAAAELVAVRAELAARCAERDIDEMRIELLRLVLADRSSLAHHHGGATAR